MTAQRTMEVREAIVEMLRRLRRRGFEPLPRGRNASRYARWPGTTYGIRISDHAIPNPSGRPDMLRHVVIVGRGAGLATLAPLARAARARGIGVTALLSARRPELVVSEAVFRAEGARVVTVTDEEGTSGTASVERGLRGLLAEGRCDAFLTCGSARLLRVQQALAREFGIGGQVALEQGMACGLGLCFCCVRDFREGEATVHRRVCWDGPVFDLAEAVA